MIRALYVDDEESLLELTKLFLERDERIMAVDTCDNAREAIGRLEQEEFDVVVSDYEMPDMDGIGLLKEIRSRDDDVPFILFTGRGREEVAIEAIDNGADFYIQKGGDPRSQFTELLHKMNVAVDHWRGLKEVKGFCDIVNHMQTGLIILQTGDLGDPEACTVLSMNPVASALAGEWGFEEGSTIGHIISTLPPEAKDRLSGLLWKVYETGESESINSVEIIEEDGGRSYYDMEIIRHDKGRMALLFQDVTAWVKSLVEGEASEQRAELQRTAAVSLAMDRAVSSGEIPAAFHRMTEAICGGIGARRCSIWEVDEHAEEMRCLSLYDGPSASHGECPVADYERARPYLDRLKDNIILKSEDISDDLELSDHRQGCIMSEDACSMIDTGMVVDGELRGVICLESCDGPRCWLNDEEAFMGNMSALGAQVLLAHDRNLALGASQEGEKKLSLAIENSDMGVWEWYPRTGEAEVNDRWLEAHGYTPEELRPISIETWRGLCHPDDIAASEQAMKEHFDGASDHYQCVVRLRCKDGGWAWVKDHGQVMERDDEGRPLRVIGTHADITKEKEAELELQHSYDMLSYIVENSTAAIAIHDRDLNYLFVSKGYKQQYGVEGDIIGKHHYEVFPDLPQKLREVHQRCLRGAVESAEMDSYEHEDGSVDWTRWECMPWYQKDGSIGGIVVNTEVITEQVEEKERLRRTEELFTILNENTADNITILDMDLNVVFTTTSLQVFGRHTAEEETGKNISEIMTPESYRNAVSVLERSLQELEEGKAPQDIFHTLELEDYHKDGHTVWVEVNANFLLDYYGRPEGIIAVSRDITERKAAERKLAESEMLYRTLIEASNTGAWEISALDRKVWCSPEYYTMLGHPPDMGQAEGGDSMENALFDLIHPEDRDAAARRLLSYIESGSTSLYESQFRMRRADGSHASILSRGRRLTEEDGRPADNIVGAHIDISSQIEAFEVMLETRTQMADVIRNLPDPTMVVSRDGTVLYWNKAMEEITGVAAEEIVGRGDQEYSVPFYGERRPVLLDLALNPDSGTERHYEHIERRGDTMAVDDVPVTIGGKKMRLWAMARPIYGCKGELIGAIETVRDVTDRKLAEEALRSANRQLTLLTGVTRHDVLNQTLALGGFLRMMLDDPDMRTSELIERLMEITEKIHSQIDFTKLYGDIGSQAPEWQQLEDTLPPEQDFDGLRLENDTEGIMVFADTMLPKVFTNLLDNTLRHGDGANIVRLGHRVDDGHLTIFWEDDGKGIDADDKQRIFERAHGINTGMGLFIIKEILAITGIEIEETGAPGKGARFELRIPPGRYRSGH